MLDQTSSQVLAFANDGTFLNAFGSFGGNDGEITRGGSILCGPDGSVCVSDRFQNRVVVFSETGEFRANIDMSAGGPAGLSIPTGLAIDEEGVLYVASTEGKRIDMFLLPSGQQQGAAYTVEQLYPPAFDTISATGVKLVAAIEAVGDPGAVEGVDFQLFEENDLTQPVREAIGVVPTGPDSTATEHATVVARWALSEPLAEGMEYAWRSRVQAENFVGEWTELRRFVTGSLPVTFALGQNYPNPFNPETSIRFSLPEQSDATLSIFNLLGQQVRVLISENLPAGEHVVLWDGTTESGAMTASGIYFYRLTAGSNRMTKKMILLK